MIKQLITDIAYDNISLSKALTRAKIVSSKIKNDSFKRWLTNELEGYQTDELNLIDYRKIRCSIFFRFSSSNVGIPVLILPTQNIYDLVCFHRVFEAISIIEYQLNKYNDKSKQATVEIELDTVRASALFNLVKESDRKYILYESHFIGAYQEVNVAFYQNIIELTKQKLLDTLLELNDEFPNLENEFAMTKENEEKVKNIITNHIYGDNNPTNIATGVNVEQTINTSTIKQGDEEKLKSYGVTQEEINELKSLIEQTSNDKPKLVGKAMKWLGSVTASVAGRGLYEHIPAITDFIHKLTT